MKNIYHRLLLLIAGSTQKELASQIRYLKIENQVLRSKLPSRVQVTPQERNKLVKFGSKLGKAMGELVTIVHPDTLRRWIRESKKATKRRPAKKGRPRTKEEIRELIIKLARENDWGYTRIMGELKKLGVKPPSRNTVKSILKENGLEPGPKRGAGTWDEFLKIHAATLWQCDFYSKKVLTIKGFRDLFLLVFLHVESRRVFVAPSTFHPNEKWVKEQAHAFLTHVSDSGLGATVVMHDRDTKFTASFDECLESTGIDVKKAAPRSPNTNAFVERFIQTMQQEVLDYFIVFGEQHMDHIVCEALAYYHEERLHQAKENVPLTPAKASKSGKKPERKKDKSGAGVVLVSPDRVPSATRRIAEALLAESGVTANAAQDGVEDSVFQLRRFTRLSTLAVVTAWTPPRAARTAFDSFRAVGVVQSVKVIKKVHNLSTGE